MSKVLAAMMHTYGKMKPPYDMHVHVQFYVYVHTKCEATSSLLLISSKIYHPFNSNNQRGGDSASVEPI